MSKLSRMKYIRLEVIQPNLFISKKRKWKPERKRDSCPEEGWDGEEDDHADGELAVWELLCKNVSVPFLPFHFGTVAGAIFSDLPEEENG